MKKTLALSAAFLTAVASASFAQNQPGRAEPQGQPTAAQQHQPGAEQGAAAQPAAGQQAGAQEAGAQGRQAEGNPQEMQQDYLQHMSSDNQYEIRVGQLAQQKSNNQQVKQLGQRLAQDHQQAQQQLEQVAKAAGANVNANELTPVDQARLQALEKKQGEEFDLAFTFGQVGDHEKDILVNMWESEHAQNPQVKQFAQQVIPTLQEHLQLARRAAEQWVPQARTAGERMHGMHGMHGMHEQMRGREEGGQNAPGQSGAGQTGAGQSGAGQTGGAGEQTPAGGTR